MALTRLNLRSRPTAVSELVNMATFEGYELDLNPPYQRGSVWTDEMRRRYIYSVRRGLPLSSIVVNHRIDALGRSSRDEPENPRVVDGKQRLESLMAFVQGRLSVPTEWFDDRPEIAAGTASGPASVPEDYEGDTILFTQMSPTGQRDFKTTPIPLEESSVATEAEEAEIFLLINTTGVEQTPETIQEAQRIAAQKPSQM